MILKLIDKKKISGNIISFIFKPGKKLRWKAGQYLIYSLPHEPRDLRGKMRFFTISSAPYEKNPVITTKIGNMSSTFKKTLDKLKIGMEIEAKGPDGDFVIGDLDKNYIFIAGGIGITPFISIIRELDFRKKPINVTLLYENKTKDITFKDELDKIADLHPEFKLRYLISSVRINQEYLKNIIGDFRDYIFYVSGPDPMVEATVKLLKDLDTPEENIKEDYFSGYGGI